MTYNKDIKGHSISALAGWTMQYQRDESKSCCQRIYNKQYSYPECRHCNAETRTLLNGLCFLVLPEFNTIIKVNICLLERFVQMVPRFGKENRWGGSLQYSAAGV